MLSIHIGISRPREWEISLSYHARVMRFAVSFDASGLSCQGVMLLVWAGGVCFTQSVLLTV